MSSRTERIIFFCGLFGLWWGLAAAHFWPPTVFPPPSSVFLILRSGFGHDAHLRVALATSLQRIFWGYGVSVIGGLGLGLLTARVRWFENTVGSLLIGLQTLPSICWLPAAIVWFGFSETAILFVVVMGSMIAIAIGTHDAIQSLPPIYMRAGATMGVTGLPLYKEILLPAALPGIVTALKQGWTFAWRSLMSGELLFENPGLGQLLQQGRKLNDMNLVVAVMIIIMILGWFVDRFVFSRWEDRIRHKRGMLTT